MTISTEQYYAAALAAAPHWGGKRLRALHRQCGSWEAIWHMSAEELRALLPGTEAMWQAFAAHRQTFDGDAWQKQMEARGVQLVTYGDTEYPSLLKETYNPPVVLYYWGQLDGLEKSAAIVGARKATPYGLNAAQTIAEELARQDVVIVSGGARGIDTKAHCGALSASGQTIAVVAHGLDTIYPRENKKLFQNIIDTGGAVMTEYTFGVPPAAFNFPARNRIIAGISRCVIVVEAALKSGSLITADFALEEGRDVFAVPGSIFSTMSRGTNNLLRKGAIALAQSEDVLTEYGWERNAKQDMAKAVSLTLSESAVLDVLSCEEAMSQEKLVLTTELPVPQLMPILLRLQLYGLIEETGRGMYVKKAAIAAPASARQPQ